MKIAIVSHSYPTQKSPARAIFIKNETQLIAQDYKVSLFLTSVYAFPFQQQYYRTYNPIEDHFPIQRLHYLSFPKRRMPGITRYSLSKNLLQKLKKFKPDLVHLHWLYPSGLAVPALDSAGFPTVITIHGGDWYKNMNNKKLMPYLKESMKKTNSIICVGKQLLKDITGQYPELESKLYHIPHGINTKLFELVDYKKKNQLKEKLHWDKRKINLLCVANLYEGKGIDILVKALAALNKESKLHLHIISPHANEKYKIKVTQLIEDLNLDSLVTFYPQKSHNQLPKYFQAADLVVSPSRKEGFGLVVAEAISCGTPVLATQSGGPEEIINNNCGMLVEADDSEALKEGLKTILSKLPHYDPVKLHNYIKETFSLSVKQRELMKIYSSI